MYTYTYICTYIWIYNMFIYVHNKTYLHGDGLAPALRNWLPNILKQKERSSKGLQFTT